MYSFFTTFSAMFTRGDPLGADTVTPRDSLPTLPSSAAPSSPSAWQSDTYSNATTLLHSGSVDAYVTQHALYPSAWWLR